MYIAKRKYYNNLINMYNSNSRKQWQIMNTIINRKKNKNKTHLKYNNKGEHMRVKVIIIVVQQPCTYVFLLFNLMFDFKNSL